MPTLLAPQALRKQTRARLNPLTAWHLVSLDAPTVATLWTAFLARATHTRLPATLLPAMFLAVWLLYAADRLLDARPPDTRLTPAASLEERHLFHHRHARAFLPAMACATLALIPLVAFLPRRDLLLYTGLAALLAAWFALIHFLAPGRALPKELTAALFFAAAVTIPTHAPLLLTALFGALCALNLFLISQWESAPPNPPTFRAPSIAHFAMDGSSANSRSQPAFLNLTASILVLLPCALIATHRPWTIVLLAISLASFFLLTLNLRHRRIPRTTLRALADFALLTPILLWPWLR